MIGLPDLDDLSQLLFSLVCFFARQPQLVGLNFCQKTEWEPVRQCCGRKRKPPMVETTGG